MSARGEPRNKGYVPRIIALGMQGLTAQAIAHRTGCNEVYAQEVLGLWRAEGGEPIVTPPKRRYQRVVG